METPKRPGDDEQSLREDRSDRREVIEGVGDPAKEKTLADPPHEAEPEATRDAGDKDGKRSSDEPGN